MHSTDTIAAVATAPGAGGIGVVRMSGPQARAIAEIMGGTPLRPRYAHYTVFRDERGEVIDDGLALSFPSPQSYTGEDVAELQIHGSPILLQQLLQRCFTLGARPARPGEFTERAYRNHRLDLAQAEAVADLIAAGSHAAARAARRSLDGAFSHRVTALSAELTELRVYVEAAIDFPEEEADFLADAALGERLDKVCASHMALLTESARGQRLRDGLHVVIVGPPNAGKSCLLNALAGTEAAIVTELPGTTRDLIRETVRLGDVEITLVDTAGLRDSDDAIEREGMRRARAELSRADLVLAVVDATEPLSGIRALESDLAEAKTIIWLHNKVDLLTTPLSNLRAGSVYISARSGLGLDALRQRLLAAAAGPGSDGTEGGFSARSRHVEALLRVGRHLEITIGHLHTGRAGELAAEELRLAQTALGELIGPTSSDDLLGEIFGSFCIGK